MKAQNIQIPGIQILMTGEEARLLSNALSCMITVEIDHIESFDQHGLVRKLQTSLALAVKE